MSLEREVKRRMLQTIRSNPVAYDEQRKQYVWVGGHRRIARAVRAGVKAEARLRERQEAQAIPVDAPLLLKLSKPAPESLSSLAQRLRSPSSAPSSRSS